MRFLSNSILKTKKLDPCFFKIIRQPFLLNLKSMHMICNEVKKQILNIEDLAANTGKILQTSGSCRQIKFSLNSMKNYELIDIKKYCCF